MLDVVSLSHQDSRRGDQPPESLDNVHFMLPRGHLAAVIGGAKSGRSTLMHLLGCLLPVQAGAILWNGRDIAQQPLLPNEAGLVTADEAALHPLLSVKEHIVSALMLGIGGVSKRDILVQADKLMVLCGIEPLGGQRVQSLSTANRRRLALAIALAADPPLVLCDGFSDGTDPKSERELGALLKDVAKAHPWRVIVNATPSVANLSNYDSVIVMHEGCVCFHGPGRAITHYFSIPHTEDLFHRLAMRPVARWQDSWMRHRDSYYAAFKLARGNGSSEADLGAASDDDGKSQDKNRIRLGAAPVAAADSETAEAPMPEAPPSAPLGTQLGMLVSRRFTVFRRAKRELWTQLGLIVGAPLLALMIAWPEIPLLKEFRSANAHLTAEQASHLGAFVSGYMFLLVLLGIAMAVYTSAREIAQERAMWVRERRAGLGPVAYLLGKAFYIVPLILAQSLALAIAVDALTGGLPGNVGVRVLLLAFTSIAMAALCLGISAFSRTADQAAARCWALAFLQVPLSGAVVALPSALGSILHPLTTAFYGWSGNLDAMKGSVIFEAMTKLNSTWYATPGFSLIMLAAHTTVGITMIVSRLRK